VGSFADINSIISDTAEMLKPPRRLTVPEAAEKHIMLDTPGGYSGPWKNDLPYYMVTPADCLTSRAYNAVIFVGPAQCAKTQMLVDNWAAHTVTCDPADHMVVQTAQDTARDYSKRRIDRMLDASPDVGSKLKKGASNDNTFDKIFRSGMILSLGWPTKNQLAGKAIGKMALTDYDRMPDDVDGEGQAFFLALKRTTTFLSRGMTMAESSPSKPIIDPKWKQSPGCPHEAPPTKGILGLYNTGDRRRIYGQCPHCREYFTPAPGIEAMYVPEEGTAEERAAAAELICTECGTGIAAAQEREYKRSGVWLREGQTITPDGEIIGEGRTSKRASFWLPGWFAAFQTWGGIVYNYLQALGNYEKTGDEEALKNCVNVDMGAPYLAKAQENDDKGADDYKERAENQERYILPEGCRTLMATVDIQGGKNRRFVIQVLGFGKNREQWLIDRFSITDSKRLDEDGKPLRIDPASHIEDWELLTEKVVKSTYRLPSGGKELRVYRTGVDSGGEAGVTTQAYEWWRSLKKQGLHTRVRLIKGDGAVNAPRIKETYPDNSNRKDRNSGARGDVPVLRINTDLIKDSVFADLSRERPGPGFIHFPDWLGDWFYEELATETRTDKGWRNPLGKPNEAFDLLGYARALWIFAGGESINWDAPKSWVQTWDKNSEITTAEARREVQEKKPPPPKRQGRRVRHRFGR